MKKSIPLENKNAWDNTKMPPKSLITDKLRIDLGRSVELITVIQQVWLTQFTGYKPYHLSQKLIYKTDYMLSTNIYLLKLVSAYWNYHELVSPPFIQKRKAERHLFFQIIILHATNAVYDSDLASLTDMVASLDTK